MNADYLDHKKGNFEETLPELSPSSLEVLPPLIGQITTSVILSSISVFQDVKATCDPNAPRKLEVLDLTDSGKSSHDPTETRRRRYSVDYTTFDPSKVSTKDNSNLLADTWTMFREQGDRFRRRYNDKFLTRHHSWKRYESRSLDENEESIAENLLLENANASIHDPCYKAITQVGTPGWLHDETIDMSFDMLERISKSEKHGIALSNTTFARDLFVVGEHYMAALEQAEFGESCYQAPHFDIAISKKFTDKKFLIFPINDAYAAELDKTRSLQARAFSQLDVNPKGSHWSVMIVDCRGPTMSALYLDSLRNGVGNRMSINTQVAEYILLGLELLTAKSKGTTTPVDLAALSFTVDPNTPSQIHNNESGKEESVSACGPFVFLIAKEFVQYIVECYEDGKPESIGRLGLPPGFAARLEWDSRHTRQAIRRMVDGERRTREWLNMTSAWFDVPPPVSLTGWQTWLRSRQLQDSRYFWDPRLQSIELAPWFNKATV